jgi:protein-disulfide isomerase
MARRAEYGAMALLGLALLIMVDQIMATHAAVASDLFAEVDGVAITAEEVDKGLSGQLAQLQEQIYDLRREKVDALIAEWLLEKEAARRGMSVSALLEAEVAAKAGLVTGEEVEAFYQANETRLKGNNAKLREQIRAHLQQEKLEAQRGAFVQSLRSQANVVVHLKPPPPLRVQIAADGSLFRGPETAPVAIVEFTDFHCPFCKSVQPTLAQLRSRYGEKVRLVHRDFPIDQLHPNARKAHEAARCANEQGKFWTYHDALYANAPKAGPADLKAYARDGGLDVSAFEHCLTNGKYQAAVQKDVDEGARLGVTGTPVFFINGRMLSGAQSLETFARVVDEELAQVR